MPTLYMHWEGMTPEEKMKQLGLLPDMPDGKDGHLREPFKGSPHVTVTLAPEAFEQDPDCTCDLEGLEGRELFDISHRCPYHLGVPIGADTLAERLESALDVAAAREASARGDTATTQEGGDTEPVKNLRQFVELAQRKESETGKPVRIYASI